MRCVKTGTSPLPPMSIRHSGASWWTTRTVACAASGPHLPTRTWPPNPLERPEMSDRKPRQPEQLTDRLFATERNPEDFRFDASVARVFPDMIRRSVPGYTTIIPMIEVITEQYVQPGSRCYDLGCSLGASTLAMRHGIPYSDCTLIGVDNSSAMIERCEHYVALDDHQLPVTLLCEDILDTELTQASVTTLNFTLQFVPPERRLDLLTRIADATLPGGVLILSEKNPLRVGIGTGYPDPAAPRVQAGQRLF